MDQKTFNAMIDDGTYHFFVFSCPAIIPFNIALHTRIVIVHPNGEIVRRELGYFKDKKNPSRGYIHKNFLPPRKGIPKYFWKTNKYFPSTLLYHSCGDMKSSTYTIVSSLETYIQKYPYKQHYRLVWHNSNYFTQWILTCFPEIKFSLPRNAVGK